MATPTAPLAYVEIAPHSLHLAVLAGRKVLAIRAFSLDAKADLAAFVAEHQLVGVARASLLAGKNFLHRSADAESGAVRQPAALQAHVGKLPHGFDGSPSAVVCDAATGGTLDQARVTPWLLAAADTESLTAAKESLGALGLAPVDITLAAPNHLGVVASSLSVGEVALVLIPGEETASLAWVTTEGVQAVASCPVGYASIFEAVQHGLGLKFKAAAGKLFYNDNYDFADAAPKIAAALAETLKPSLTGAPASILHIVGLTPGQAWLGDGLAGVLGMKFWKPDGAALIARLGLESSVAQIPFTAAGLFCQAAAGSSDAAWVPSTLETLIARSSTRKTAVPFPKPAPNPGVASPAPTAASAKPVAPVAPNKAPAPVARPAAPKPVPKAAPAPAPQPVVAVAVEDTQDATAGRKTASAAAAKSKKSPLLIIGAVSLVAIAVGIAAMMRNSTSRADKSESSPPSQPSSVNASSANTATAVTTPSPASANQAVSSADTTSSAPPSPFADTPSAPEKSGPGAVLAADERKFSNDRYRLEITEKGFIQALSTPSEEVLVESAAGISLQGSYIGTDGRRKWFNVGGVDDIEYEATVSKAVRQDVTIFDIKITHPRFQLEQSFHCLADTVKVTSKFTPIDLRDPRGVVAAVHSVRLSPAALNSSSRMRATGDSFAYAMKAGTLRVGFDGEVWSRDGADGKQTIIAGENGVAFHFTETAKAPRNQLNYEIVMP